MAGAILVDCQLPAKSRAIAGIGSAGTWKEGDLSNGARSSKPTRGNADERDGSKSNKADLVAEILRRQIATGARLPGSLLPPEGQLGQEFGISRPSHREAIRVLSSEGLIRVARGARGGAEVLMPEVGPVARWVGIYLQMHKVSFAALMEARKTYEPAAAAAIASRRDQSALAALAQCASAQQFSIHDRGKYNGLEVDFVRMLVEFSANPVLELIGSLLHEVYDRGIRTLSQRVPSMSFEPGHLQNGVQGKQRLIRLMANGDAAGAAKAWETYIDIFERRLFQLVPSESLIEVYGESDTETISIGLVD